MEIFPKVLIRYNRRHRHQVGKERADEDDHQGDSLDDSDGGPWIVIEVKSMLTRDVVRCCVIAAQVARR